MEQLMTSVTTWWNTMTPDSLMLYSGVALVVGLLLGLWNFRYMVSGSSTAVDQMSRMSYPRMAFHALTFFTVAAGIVGTVGGAIWHFWKVSN